MSSTVEQLLNIHFKELWKTFGFIHDHPQTAFGMGIGWCCGTLPESSWLQRNSRKGGADFCQNNVMISSCFPWNPPHAATSKIVLKSNMQAYSHAPNSPKCYFWRTWAPTAGILPQNVLISVVICWNFPILQGSMKPKLHANMYMVAVDTRLRNLSSGILKICFGIVEHDWSWKSGFLLAKTVTTLAKQKTRRDDYFPDLTFPTMGWLEPIYMYSDVI